MRSESALYIAVVVLARLPQQQPAVTPLLPPVALNGCAAHLTAAAAAVSSPSAASPPSACHRVLVAREGRRSRLHNSALSAVSMMSIVRAPADVSLLLT